MSLLSARITFTRHLGRLLVYAAESGFDVIIDEVKRSPIQAQWNSEHCKVFIGGKRCEEHVLDHPEDHAFRAIGIKSSIHLNALAADLLIMRDGQIVNDEAPYQLLGEWWEDQFPEAAWGGRFNDMGHFSHGWNGRK